MTLVKSIATEYNGRTFRSKLEADWAAYFDYAGIEWAYEPEGYQLSNGALYLPDFFLGRLGVFVECRGALTRSLRRPALFIKDTSKPLLVALPEGRFFLATIWDQETGARTGEYVEALFASDQSSFEKFQKARSCMVILDDDAEGEPRAYFSNAGESSPDYCGYDPDWMNCIKDRNRKGNPLMDARATYYGGYSTWAGRGFERRPHRVGTKLRR